MILTGDSFYVVGYSPKEKKLMESQLFLGFT